MCTRQLKEGEKYIIENATKCKGVVLFGAGVVGQWAYDWCKNNNLNILFFCDNNERVVGQKKVGLDVFAPKKIEGENNVYVLISCDAQIAIRKQLEELGTPRENIGFFDKLWVSNIDFKGYFEKHRRELEDVYNILADKKSKEVYKALLQYKATANQEYITNIVDDHREMYFDKELICNNEIECFIDVGAYTGDTLVSYVSNIGRPINHYWCIEPNPNNLLGLEKCVETLQLDNVSILRVGVSNTNAVLRFNVESGAASHISEHGTEKVQCTTLDTIFENQKICGNIMIKMDIEGAEKEALLGAKSVIKKYHPIFSNMYISCCRRFSSDTSFHKRTVSRL